MTTANDIDELFKFIVGAFLIIGLVLPIFQSTPKRTVKREVKDA